MIATLEYRKEWKRSDVENKEERKKDESIKLNKSFS